MKRRKIWVSLGTAVLVTSQVAAHEERPLLILGDGVAQPGRHAAAAHRHGAPIVLAAKAKAGGEGGEGDEGGEGAKASYDASLKPSVRFYRDVELIRGHLLVGDELVREKRWAEALPHFLHPSEEIYGKIRKDLKTYEVPPFLAALKALAQTVKAKNEGAYRTALAALEERLAAADKGVKAKEADWQTFVVDTVLEMLRTATGEYEEAIAKGRIAKPVEYQDSRGFVFEAEKLFGTVAEGIGQKDADAVKGVQAAFAELKKAWPAPVPPKTPVRDVSQVLADVSKIELQLGRFR
jgi:hypothetical protein